MAQLNIKQIRGLTAGSILYLNSDSIVTEDFSKLNWNFTDQKLNINGSINIQGTSQSEVLFSVSGTQGELFSITDDLEGLLFSVNDISGIPVFEVYSDNTVKIGEFGSEAIIVEGSEVKLNNAQSDNSVTTGLFLNDSNQIVKRTINTSAFSDVNDGLLTLSTSGIATGSATFSANQLSSSTFTVSVPGTNIAQGTRTSTSVPITSSTGTDATLSAATNTLAGVMTSTDKTKLDGIEDSANNYVHPTHAGDDIDIDTGYLTGATVISDLDFNVTTDTLGHVTDANATYSTRTLTTSDIGAEPAFAKNTAFNKNFGTTSGTVAEGDDSRIVNGQTAFGWGDHTTQGYLINNSYITVGGVTANGPISTSDNLYVSGKINTNSHRIAGWHIIEQNFIYVGAQEANPTGIVFDPTGTRMFYCGYSTNRIFQYNLSTPWDLLTAVDSGLSFYLSTGGLGGTIEDIYISPDGLNLYAVSRSNDTLGQYELASAWDLTSVSHIRTLPISSYDENPTSVYFKDDGSVLYLLGYSSDDIYQISLSTPWDISTVGLSSSFSLNEFGISTPQGIEFNGDGTSLYIIGSSSDRITQFDLSTPWDITTATIGGYSPFYGYSAGSSTSLFYDSASNNAFIIGISSDRIYQLNTQIPTEFETPVIFDKSVTIDNNIEVRELATFRGPSVFYNSSNFNSTFTAASTTRLIYGNGGTLDVGSTLNNNTSIRIGYNNFYPIDPSVTKSISLFRNFIGAKGTIYIAETPTYTSNLINGIIDIDSNADTFDHEGELSVGRTLKVSGSQNLKYKEDNLHLEGNVSVLDTFIEASDTDISLHTPDIGNGYTQVYSNTPIAEFPIVSGGNGWMQPNSPEDNDGYIYTNNTTIGIADYEVRATIRRQPTDTDATFWLIARYQDNDNFYAMSFASITSYTVLYKRVAGVDTQLGVLNYWVDTRGNTDEINIDVALRVIGNELSVFYNGEYRGTAIDSSITDAGKAGFGFGAIFPSTLTSMDISNQWRISQYKVTELPSSLFSGDDSIHYINKGRFGIGTTSPTAKLHVQGITQSEVLFRISGIQGDIFSISENGDLFSGSSIIKSGITYSYSDSYLLTAAAIDDRILSYNYISSTFSNITGLTSGGIVFGDQNGKLSQNATVLYWDNDNLRLGINTSNPDVTLEVNGDFAATTKSFLIDHPSKPGVKLRHGSLEGPENGVYIRGRLTNNNIIELPDYWIDLVDELSITVQITPIGSYQQLYVDKVEYNKVFVGGDVKDCYYLVNAERKDVKKMIVEFYG